MRHTLRIAALSLAAGLLAATGAAADEATIRKAFAERLPDFPKIDEVTKTAIPGIYELRIGTDVLYTDEQGTHLFEGQLIDTRTRRNLTQARIDKLTEIDVASLPLKDAIVWKQGNGSRKLVVFADPNCGYCKRFERDLNGVRDVTVYTFLLPILGGDSPEKSRDIWCAKDNTKAWRDWMLQGIVPPRNIGKCDTTAFARTAELARKHRINGTPAIVFEDGKRVPGAMTADQVEKQLVASRTRP
jgi:thiol:disulfide interchange protein DsbC